ncbi:hypothetical protein Mhun_1885 [Methanospirillum hungatei JF-1]|uniref:Uncharacterized protein n=1 Tax=Methanospirillum hungatei JF-1 (strain ATCC 27890 / DSM 864 / NBRC 100397 / JF-1) TaxID=323259 RepID=Q2FM29_METHJ|nr:hypothetical protein Mhun_1885 [Methanospirillum hungatei JF-1]
MPPRGSILLLRHSSGYLSCCTRYLQDSKQNRMYQYVQTLSENLEQLRYLRMTTQTANSFFRLKTLINGQIGNRVFHPEKHIKTRPRLWRKPCDYEDD